MSAISFRARDRAVGRHERIDPRLARSGRRGAGPYHLTDVLLGLLVLGMLVAMELTPGEETIPYHFIFLALTLAYGFRVWPLFPTLVVTAVVTGATGWILVDSYLDDDIHRAELTEIPLMPMLFLAMVWHARRRVAALQEVELMAEQRWAMLDREREFFRDASHAIRTPVTIARGHLELLEPAIADPLAREDLEIALRQLDRMSALSNRLLALARLDAGDAVRRQPVDLPPFIEAVGQNWVSSADRDWVIDCPPVGTVQADPEWLELALDALIENAVHFTAQGDRIRLSCRADDSWYVVAVADSGPGIDTDDLPHVFERFWHRRPPDAPMGSGLGLPMAQATAQAHRGGITVGRAEEGGALFELSLPRHAAADGPASSGG